MSPGAHSHPLVPVLHSSVVVSVSSPPHPSKIIIMLRSKGGAKARFLNFGFLLIQFNAFCVDMVNLLRLYGSVELGCALINGKVSIIDINLDIRQVLQVNILVCLFISLVDDQLP